jgi:hypothetical protein
VVSLTGIATLLVHRGGEADKTKPLSVPLDVPLEKGPDTPRDTEQKQAELPPKPLPVRIASFKTMRLQEGKSPLEVKESDTLTQNDRYYVVFSTDEELYIYVVQIDYSEGSIVPIFPNRQFSSANNPVMPHSEYRFRSIEQHYKIKAVPVQYPSSVQPQNCRKWAIQIAGAHRDPD